MTDLLIRADANARMGSGHLMRCLAIAQEWKGRMGAVRFLSACGSDAVRQRVESTGIDFTTLERAHPDPSDLELTLKILSRQSAPWVVLDGYHFSLSYQRALRMAGFPVLLLDDMATQDFYEVDVLLNQNIYAETLDYRCPPGALKLLGTSFALLRPEFYPWREWRREIPRIPGKVLVTMGGGDADNITLKIIRALRQMDVAGFDVIVVVGANNPHRDELELEVGTGRAIPRPHKHSFRLIHDPHDMPELMFWCDVAISAGGSTCWELAFMGVPSALIVLADNQRAIAEGLERRGAALDLGWHEDLSAEVLSSRLIQMFGNRELRRNLSVAARALIDGRGAGRVVNALKTRSLDGVKEN